MLQKTKLAAAISAAACSMVAGQAQAQNPTVMEELVVTGIRGSMQAAMDVKRNSAGVVDAISAEDMGNFPDTNLAESLQRITGVSIDRVEGEGSQVTVRGFGGQFNMVTLNGRQMPAANVQNVGTNSFNAAGDSRSFDFSVLASEGVSGLQVYKTGRASAPSGGIGATINVETIRPLSAGTQFAVGAKAVNDTGGDLTPELSGLASWANDDNTVGVSVFASYQERSSSTRSGTFGCCVWMYPYDPENGAVVNTEHVNEPATGSLAAFPSNVRTEYATTERRRTNTMATLQFAPNERMEITVDAMYAVNEMDHNSIQDQQYFARDFDYIEWDGSDVVAHPNILTETYTEVASFTAAGTDILHDNRWVRNQDSMTSLGVNLDYQLTDDLTMNVDLASSKSESGGRWPGGYSLYRAPIAGAVSGWRGVDMSGDVPHAAIAITDGQGDQDGIYESVDVGSQQARRSWNEQTHDVDQFQVSGNWDNGGNITAEFGMGYIGSEMNQYFHEQGDTLGGWGVSDTGDIERMAPGIVTMGCTICEFEQYNFDASEVAAMAPAGASLITLGEVSARVNPRELWYGMDGYVNAGGDVFDANNPGERGVDSNLIEETITSAYFSSTMDGEIGNRPMQLVAGVRWEETQASSATEQVIVEAFVWTSDNDMTDVFGDEVSVIEEEHSYSNLLPNLDFSVDLTDDFKARASFSSTLARPQYSHMFVKTNVGDGDTLTYLGGIPSGSKGTAKLDPLVSANFDLSAEYYYGEDDYASVGFFKKAVSNFVGTTQVPEQHFGLRDVTARGDGNRLDLAIEALEAGGWSVSEESLFTMTAILDNPDEFPGGAADYDGTGDQALAVFSAHDVAPNEDDPLYTFQMQLPVNNQTANIYGWEMAWQHFFSSGALEGFGFMANATFVNGDIAFDNAAAPNFDQFALEGLSDSSNLILVYENETFGARLAYNWRDSFLSSTNAGDFIPQYYEEHAQVDVNFSWNVTDQLSLAVDGINLTEEGVVTYARTRNMNDWSKEADARWVLSAMYNF